MYNSNFQEKPQNQQNYLESLTEKQRDVNANIEKNNSTRKKIGLIFICLIFFILGGIFSNVYLRNTHSESYEDSKTQDVTQPQETKQTGDKYVFYKPTGEEKEGFLKPEDLILQKEGSTPYTYDSDGNMVVNASDVKMFVMTHTKDTSSYSTTKGIVVGDDWDTFVKTYGDYFAHNIKVFENGEYTEFVNMTVNEFIRDYIDTGVVNINEPDLDLFVTFSAYSDGMEYFDINYGKVKHYENLLCLSFQFDSADRYGNNVHAENNKSSGLYIESIDTSYYRFD